MPIGEFLGELAAQAVMEGGGHAIHGRFGWKGCVVALALLVGVIALVIWLLL